MERILVMGPPGSGKSTLARHIGARYGLPVFHLDQAFWLPGWIEAPADVFRAEVERIATLPRWVIDGNYPEVLAPRLRMADTLIYLDAPTWLSLQRIVRRVVTGYGRVRPDSAPGCPEKIDLPFLCYAARWNSERRAATLAFVAGFAGRTIVVCAPAAVQRMLTAIEA